MKLDHVSEAAARAEGILGSILGSARAEDVYGPTTVVGERTVIPVAAIERTGGFGFGGGGGADAQENEGGGVGAGGGGASSVRPVAVIEVDDTGVVIRPVVDTTKVALAGVAVLLALFRARRGR